ncbi:hypothetical protein K0W35_001198 [Vibrio parahaemolyticus]|nr:hypothetical protein [Vibrio parahaemolyticus]
MAGRRTKRTKSRDEAYFVALKNGETIKQAAKIAGYSYRAVMYYKSDDPEFSEKHYEAVDHWFECHKEKAHEAVMNGFKEKQVITKDGTVKTILTTRESAAHLKFMLRAHEAGKFYYENGTTSNSEPLDGGNQLDLSRLSKESLKELLDTNDDLDKNGN